MNTQTREPLMLAEAPAHDISASSAPSGFDFDSDFPPRLSPRLRVSALKAILLLAATLTLCAQPPTPESVLGYKPGADFHLATYDDALAYFRKVAAASNRIKLVPVGKTT